MLVNVCLVKLFHGRAFFVALLSVMLGSVLLTYASLQRCFRLYVSPATAAFCASLIAAQFLLMVGSGMEIVLTVPLLCCLCLYRLARFEWTASGGVSYGLLASLLILSRLDSILFVIVLCVLDLVLASRVPWATRWKTAAGFLVGSIPVVAYLASNLLLFHSLVPVSATAKQLRATHVPSAKPWDVALIYNWPIPEQLDRPVLAGVLLAAALLVFHGRGRLADGHKALVWALLLFPVIQLAALSILSDWPLWVWYLYPFLGAIAGVVLVLGTREEPFLRRWGRFAPALVALAAFLFAAKSAAHAVRATAKVHDQQFEIYYGGRDLANFSHTHPGIYAMGDRSGIFGYLQDQPVVQLEGLVMDKPYLDNIRQERNLVDVLRAYHVRYYVANNPELVNGCLAAREPMQGGPASYSMHGTFCRPPVYGFSYGNYRTYVFDMDGQ